MFRAIAIAALAAFAFTISPATAQQGGAPDVTRKLYELGYPADQNLAIQRWRGDTRRTGDGPLSPDETSALMAQTPPEFFSAMTGNPFTGMGLALRHEKRDEAEREAVRLCKAEGGGSTCTSPLVIRAGLCVVVVGYTVKIDRRPHHRVSVAISSDMKLARERGQEGCQTGATHPQLCKTLITYCGDGSQFDLRDDEGTAEAQAVSEKAGH